MESILMFLLMINFANAEPVLHFSDLISGPKTGWSVSEPDKGVAVTIWGKNFGTNRKNNYITINGEQLISDSDYAEWGVLQNDDRELERITFWLNSNCHDGPGSITVNIEGAVSNSLNFTVRTGGIYFVDDTSPDDIGSGTYEDPWRSPATYYNSAVAGDTCYFRAGTYNGTYGYSSGGGNFVVNVGSGSGYCAAGTEENPIAYVAYPDETVIFDALGETSPTSNFRIYSNIDPAWYVVSKLNLKAYNQCVGSAGTGWRIVGNDCEGITRTTPLWAGSIGTNGGSAKILGNNVHGGRSESKMDHAIYPGGCPSNGGVEIGWNHIYDNSFARGPLISINHEGNRCGDTEYVDDCYIHDNVVDATNYPCRGISIFQMSYATGDPVEPTAYIYNNIFINCGITDEYGPHPAIVHQNAHAYIYNNNFYNTRTRAIALYSYVGSSSFPLLSTTIKNNIFHMRSDSDTYIYVDYNIEDSRVVIDSNCYYGKGSYSGDDFNAINLNPLFVNPSTSDFSLQSTSPCIDAGTSTVSSIVTKDFIGNSRPMDGDGNGTAEYDIGAYEYTGAYTPDTTPPTRLNSQPATNLSSGGNASNDFFSNK